MVKSNYTHIGRGVYSVGEAERLTKVPARSIRRWTRGDTFEYRGEKYHSPAVIAADNVPVDGRAYLTFADLMEVRFLQAFRSAGVRPKAIRVAAERAREVMGETHPFSTQTFRTDGRTIIAEIVEREDNELLLDLVRDQYEIEPLVSPHFLQGVEFEGNHPRRWRPVLQVRVVLDPAIALGAPTIEGTRILTRTLARNVVAGETVEDVSRWFDIDVGAVRDAIQFESFYRQ